MMYTDKEKQKALELYDDLKSVTKAIRALGYPARKTMYCWIEGRGRPARQRSKNRGGNTPGHPRHPSAGTKLDILRRCFELGEDVKSVSEETGYSRPSIYAWRKKCQEEGAVALMNRKDIPRGRPAPEGQKGKEGEEDIKAQIKGMQLEIDILKETIEVLKKDPGIDLKRLRNKEKAAMADALRNRYPLPMLLKAPGMPRSSYYYQEKRLAGPDRHEGLAMRITSLFEESFQRYGYRRIHAMLAREGCRVSEKTVRRLMRENRLAVYGKRARKYSSYQGETSEAAPNVIGRDFHADAPNRKWLTDITEFALPAGKVYLSPIVDCFDGLVPSWRIGTSPDSALVNGMLEEAIGGLRPGERPLVHSDRGGHYRWPGWISLMDGAGLTRSMSKKGCSPDNSACEGLFGRLKNEMFYNRDWMGVSIEEFIGVLDSYLAWYNNVRIKVSLGNMSPAEYRRSLGLAV